MKIRLVYWNYHSLWVTEKTAGQASGRPPELRADQPSSRASVPYKHELSTGNWAND